MRRGRMHPGLELGEALMDGGSLEPFLGVYDCFSATVASRYSQNLFLSGFGMAASFYGLPDVGYIAWSDMVQAAWRIRQILPEHWLLVDIDDGYVDIHTACHVTRQLDNMGVAMIMLEDQARPRRCGHADGKVILPLAAYIDKLQAVLDTRENVRVLARTDASGEDIFRRVEAMSETGADVLLVDGVDSIETLMRVSGCTSKPLLFNQIAGGKSPRLSFAQLRDAGINLVQYSTPLLFAAQRAMAEALMSLFENDGRLPHGGNVGVAECTALLQANAGRVKSGGAGFPAPTGRESSSRRSSCR